MPAQVAGRQARCLSLVQNTFEIAIEFGHTIVVAVVAAEEIRRRQLLGIAYDYGLVAASDGADRVPRRDLRGLVEDYDVEQSLMRREILRDR